MDAFCTSAMSQRHLSVPLVLLLAACPTRFDQGSPGDVTVRPGTAVLVRTAPVAPGTACPGGGQRILAGHDLDGDGLLSDSEATVQDVVCAGAPGERGGNGDAGPAGRDGLPAPVGCTPGQRLGFAVDAGTWNCAPDNNGLGVLACSAGERAAWNGQRWTCAEDAGGANTLAGLGCTPGMAGQVARFDGTQWRCDVDRDQDTLATRACLSAGERLSWNGTTWSCSTPTDQDVAGALGCTAGAVPRWNGTTWSCAVDAVAQPGVDLMRSLQCAPGEQPQFNGAIWECAADRDDAPTNCAHNGVPRWGSNGWTCGGDLDTDGLAELGCAVGEIPVRLGGMWTCGVDEDAARFNCGSGEIARFNGTTWACGVDRDENTLAQLACQPGETPKWNGAAWQCGSDGVSAPGTDTLVSLMCAPGQLAKFNGATWACAADESPLPMTCGPGELARWMGTGWSCAADNDTNTLGTLTCATGETARWNGTAWACSADANALGFPCANGQTARWGTGGWTCSGDANTDTLAALACATGQQPKWNGTAWACASDNNAPTVVCTNGQLPRFNGATWVCSTDVDSDTLGALACSNGQVAKWNGTAWACQGDDNALTISCTNGQVPRHNGTTWTCSNDVDTDTLGALACATGQVARFNGTGWACAPDNNALAITCSNGQVPGWNGTGWTCSADNDTDTLAALACASGELAKWNGSAWGCAGDANAFAVACADGQVPKWSGSGWTCGQDVDTDTLSALACSSGQLARYNGAAWVCGSDANTPAPSCSNGQILKWSGAGWACAVDNNLLATLGCTNGQVPKMTGGVFSCGPDINTLTALNCSDGQVPKRVSGAWACAADDTGTITNPFSRTFIVPPGATPTAGGTALRNAVAAITATAASPALVHVEPGLYDLGNNTLTLPDYVSLEGAGRDVTTIQSNLVAITTPGNVDIRDVRLVSPIEAVRQTTANPLRIQRASLQCNGTPTDNVTCLNSFGPSAHFQDLDVDATCPNSVSCTGVLHNTFTGAGSAVTLLRTRVVVRNGNNLHGVNLGNSATVRVSGVTVDVQSTGTGPDMRGMTISGACTQVHVDNVDIRAVFPTSHSGGQDAALVVATTVAATVSLAAIRAHVRSAFTSPFAQTDGINVSNTFGVCTARDLDVVAHGTAQGTDAVTFQCNDWLLSGARIRTPGLTRRGLTQNSTNARLAAVDLEKTGTGIGVMITGTNTTLEGSNILGPGPGIQAPTGTVGLLGSVVEGTIPAAGPSFRCVSSYAPGFARLAGCTF